MPPNTIKMPAWRTGAMVAAMICVLTGVAAFVWRFKHVVHACTDAVAVVPVDATPGQMLPTTVTGPETRRDRLTLRDGRYYCPGETVPFTGLVTQSYTNGMCQWRSAVSNGLLEGLSEGWYTNGQKQVEEHFHAGISHGVRVKWHENGRILSEASIVSGKLEGRFRRWYENGVLAEEIHLHGGNPDGLARSFYPSGALKVEAHLKEGRLLDQKNWADGESPVRAAAAPAPEARSRVSAEAIGQ